LAAKLPYSWHNEVSRGDEELSFALPEQKYLGPKAERARDDEDARGCRLVAKNPKGTPRRHAAAAFVFRHCRILRNGCSVSLLGRSSAASEMRLDAILSGVKP
jgi:hypothetical protein